MYSIKRLGQSPLAALRPRQVQFWLAGVAQGRIKVLFVALEGVEEGEGACEHLGFVLRVLSEEMVWSDGFGALFLEIEVDLLDILLAIDEIAFPNYIEGYLRLALLLNRTGLVILRNQLVFLIKLRFIRSFLMDSVP